MTKIPGDSRVRATVDPTMFYPMFADIVADLQQCGGRDAMRVLGNMLIAWDGTEYDCSDTIDFPNCSHRPLPLQTVVYG